jgi:hypothetical protein
MALSPLGSAMWSVLNMVSTDLRTMLDSALHLPQVGTRLHHL